MEGHAVIEGHLKKQVLLRILPKKCPPPPFTVPPALYYLFAEWVIASLTKASFPLNCEEEFKIHHDDTEQFNSNVKIPLVWWYVTCQRIPAYKQNVWHYSCPGFCGPFIMSFRRRRRHATVLPPLPQTPLVFGALDTVEVLLLTVCKIFRQTRLNMHE